MILFSLIFILFPIQIDHDLQNQIIFWNIGQGQWITAMDSKNCFHFDVGGEFFNPKKIIQACSKKQNVIFFSHWDWDHIGLTGKLRNSVQEICIAVSPLGNAKNYKVKLLDKVPRCRNSYSNIEKVKFTPRGAKSDNDLSHVLIYKKKLLIPGDSTKKMEKIWGPLLKNKTFKWLSVSHHGSKTSTSKEFLKNIKFPQAIVSARKKAYGHPHREVINRLKEKSTALLKTEDWGNIRIFTH